ncbi:MAG: hypothetical protein V4582_19210 [Pseudomonadota bacterium]
MNIGSIVDNAYLNKTFLELAEASPSALRGVGAAKARALRQLFNVSTVRQLAELNVVKWAAAITALADAEGSTAEQQLDEAVELTFPASDPIAVDTGPHTPPH